MKKLLFSLIVLGLMNPFVVHAKPKKGGKKSATTAAQRKKRVKAKAAARASAQREAKAQRLREAEAQRLIDDRFIRFDGLMEQGEVVAAFEQVELLIFQAAQQALGVIPRLPDFNEEYVRLILEEVFKEVDNHQLFDVLKNAALSLPGLDQKEPELITIANNILGSLMLLINYVSNDDKKEMQRLRLAQQHLAKAIAYQPNTAMESLLGGVENQLGQHAADSGDIETARFYWESAAASGNDQAKQSIYTIQLDQLRREGQRFSRHITTKLDIPRNRLEAYDRKARIEGDVEAFELMCRYYLEQSKREITVEDNVNGFLRLFRETVDRWLANERDYQADLERAMPIMREMHLLDRRCKDSLIVGLAMLGCQYERQGNYLKAAEFHKGLLDISPTHECVLNFANYYFEGSLNLKGKASWQKGIEILDSAAQENNIKAALALAKMYKAGFNFDCGGRLNTNQQKAREYEELAGRNEGIRASERIIAAFGARPSPPTGGQSPQGLPPQFFQAVERVANEMFDKID